MNILSVTENKHLMKLQVNYTSDSGSYVEIPKATFSNQALLRKTARALRELADRVDNHLKEKS
jgi:hypothetical protein